MKVKIKQTKQNLIFVILGHILLYATLYIGSITFIVWAFLQNTIY
jgi:hypothetical protein